MSDTTAVTQVLALKREHEATLTANLYTGGHTAAQLLQQLSSLVSSTPEAQELVQPLLQQASAPDPRMFASAELLALFSPVINELL